MKRKPIYVVVFAAAIAAAGQYFLPGDDRPNCEPRGEGESLSSFKMTAIKLSDSWNGDYPEVELTDGFENFDIEAATWICVPETYLDVIVDGTLAASLDLSAGRPGELSLLARELGFEILR